MKDLFRKKLAKSRKSRKALKSRKSRKARKVRGGGGCFGGFCSGNKTAGVEPGKAPVAAPNVNAALEEAELAGLDEKWSKLPPGPEKTEMGNKIAKLEQRRRGRLIPGNDTLDIFLEEAQREDLEKQYSKLPPGPEKTEMGKEIAKLEQRRRNRLTPEEKNAENARNAAIKEMLANR